MTCYCRYRVFILENHHTRNKNFGYYRFAMLLQRKLKRTKQIIRMSRSTAPLWCLLLVLLLTQCHSPQESPIPVRGQSPWAFRSVLDGQARMLTLALADGFWAAYSAQDGRLHKIWRGSVNFDGAVYTTVHGPQPSSLGDAYVVNAVEQPWSITVNGQREQPQVQYRGHRFVDGRVRIQYDLQLSNGQIIQVTEQPEYLSAAEGKQDGYERIFRVSNLPEGAVLEYTFNYQSLPALRSLDTDGELEVLANEPMTNKGLSARHATARLTLNPGSTRLATYFTKYPLVENENVTIAQQSASEPLGARLIARSDCKSCHNTYVQTVGPSYADIAKRYENNDENIAMLAGKIKKGGSGNWGEAAMTPHADLDDATLKNMVRYIMDLDAEEEKLLAKNQAAGTASLPLINAKAGASKEQMLPGLLLRIYQYDQPLSDLGTLDKIDFNRPPTFEGHVGQIMVANAEFKGLEADFAFTYQGYINIPKDNNYTFRLRSDDGSRFYIGNQLIIDHDGLHGASAMDGEVALEAGLHPISVKYFQGAGGKYISLEWKSFDDEAFEVVPKEAFLHARDLKPAEGAAPPPMAANMRIPGDSYSLEEVHPSYTLTQARPETFLPKVAGLDFLSDGRLVVSTWDAEGAVYLVDGVQSGDPARITHKKIAGGLAEPLGLKVVNDTIYVLQKQELTQLIDHDGDEMIDEYYTLSNDWKVSANFHEFAFGLAYKKGYFYAALAIAILPGGASANPQIPDRGKAIRISKNTGKLDFVATGLRTPNGVGIGVDNELFIADNQGDWLPSCKIMHVTPGDFFGSRAVDSARVAQLPVKQPVVWLPQDEIGNSPGNPSYLNDGPYQGQMIHGEVTHGGVKRVFVEKVGGEYQGAVFRFTQGLEAGINRIAWGPDSALYVGGIGSSGNWGHSGKLWYGLQRLKYNGQSTFEMLAVRAKANGMEIELTEPLRPGLGWDASAYTVQQWHYEPTSAYGGPKLGLERLSVLSATVSDDRRRVFLELDGLQPEHVVYIRLPFDWESENGRELWTTETWYTLNRIPGQAGTVRPAPSPSLPNTLTAWEQQNGWKLLFDGESTEGWRNFKKQTIGSDWKVDNGALMLDARPREDGSWQAEDGGDIITEGQYENFELRLEWKVGACGNSGIMFNVVEAEQYDYVWLTGPEMQILDNTCHPDAKWENHQAGSLYDMMAVKYPTVRPAGQWNQVRIRIEDGQTAFWLNNRRVVDFEMFTSEWERMIANSKFKEMPDFGKARKGHIALQDHGDPIWFRNIKIKEL